MAIIVTKRCDIRRIYKMDTTEAYLVTLLTIRRDDVTDVTKQEPEDVYAADTTERDAVLDSHFGGRRNPPSAR